MTSDSRWKFNKQINVSVIIELAFLAALIIGTWVNIQRQLCIMQHDLTRILETQKQFRHRMEKVSNMCIGFEYRLRSVEKNKNDDKL